MGFLVRPPAPLTLPGFGSMCLCSAAQFIPKHAPKSTTHQAHQQPPPLHTTPAIKTLTFVALSAVIAAHTALADVSVSGHISISRSLADGFFCFDDNNCHDLRPLTDSETSALLQLIKGNTTATTITLPDESSTPAPTTTSSSTRAPITPQIVCYGPYCCDRCYGWKRRRLQTADGIRQLTDAKRV